MKLDKAGYTYKDVIYFYQYLIDHKKDVIGKTDIWAIGSPSGKIFPRWIYNVQQDLDDNLYGKHTSFGINSVGHFCIFTNRGYQKIPQGEYRRFHLAAFEDIVIGQKIKQFLSYEK